MRKNINCCRVCGYELLDPPWGKDGHSPTWDFCPCCGTEFGYQDATPISVRRKRENWISNGKKWFDASKKPADWNFDEQRKNILSDF
jgi:hypothetical protein